MLKIAPVPHSWALQSSFWHCRVFSGSVCKNETDIITHPDLKIHILWLGLLLTNDTGALYITHRNWELTNCSAVHFYQDSMAPTSKHCNLCFIGGVCCRKSTQWILVFVFCRYQLHAHWHGYFGRGISYTVKIGRFLEMVWPPLYPSPSKFEDISIIGNFELLYCVTY